MNGVIEKEKIEAMIYEIRGVHVMLDSDLARLYHCTNGTKSINLAVKRNVKRFPNDFYFQLTSIEYDGLKFQNETSNLKHGGIRKLPYVFTEEGVAMLSSVLHTEVAEEVSVKIIRTFVKLRKIVSNNLVEQKYINNMVLDNNEQIKKHNKEIKILQETFNKLNEKQKINKIFYKGQVYDAYSLLIDILNKSKKEIVIIDNYAGKELLDILKNINRKITIITSNIDEVLKNKYEKQYSNVTFIKNDTFHDRFIIIDKKILYECGSSFKDLGKKCFHIGEIKEKELIESLMKKLEI